MLVELRDDLILPIRGMQVATLALSHLGRNISQLNPLGFMIKIKERKYAPSRVTLCLQYAWPTMVLFKDFMAYASGRCTPMGKEKFLLEHDVSFGT